MTDSEKIDLILSKIDKLDKIDKMENDIAEIRQQSAKMESDITELRQQSAKMESDITELRQQSAKMESNVTDIKLTLENEIRVNIQRIAEGHLDLSRNLHEAMRPSNEVEVLAIKVRQLESEVRELKQKIS